MKHYELLKKPKVAICSNSEEYKYFHPGWTEVFDIVGYWSKERRRYYICWMFREVPRKKYWTPEQLRNELFIYQL